MGKYIRKYLGNKLPLQRKEGWSETAYFSKSAWLGGKQKVESVLYLDMAILYVLSPYVTTYSTLNYKLERRQDSFTIRLNISVRFAFVGLQNNPRWPVPRVSLLEGLENRILKLSTRKVVWFSPSTVTSAQIESFSQCPNNLFY